MCELPRKNVHWSHKNTDRNANQNRERFRDRGFHSYALIVSLFYRGSGRSYGGSRGGFQKTSSQLWKEFPGTRYFKQTVAVKFRGFSRGRGQFW